jgi:hypothetical protein
MNTTPDTLVIDDPDSWDAHRRAVEYGKFAIDAAYFIDTCLVIDDAQGHGDGSGTMRFRLWPAQVGVVWELMTERLTIFLKARQLGISWICCAFELWRCLFQPGQAVLLFSIGEDEAKELLRRIRVMYERMPEWLKEQCPLEKPPNTTEIEWVNGSRVRSLPSSRVKGSSFTASSVLLDEYAKVQWADDLLAAVKPTIDGGGQLIIVSTAFGCGNKFHSLWTKASAHQNEYKPIFLPWWARPGRDKSWYARQIAEETDPGRVKENYPATAIEAFRVSGNPRFDQTWIERQTANVWDHGLPAAILPDTLKGIPGLTVYELPVKGRQYLIGADVAKGLEHGDADDAVVIDEQTWVEVAALNGRWEPDIFAKYLIALSAAYNEAIVAPEQNNHGHAVLATFRLEGFTHVLNGEYGLGWQTNLKTKPQMIDVLAEALRDGLITVRTSATLAEMQIYRREPNGDTSAPPGFFDDRVMSWAIVLSVARIPQPDYSLAGFVGIPIPRRRLTGRPSGSPDDDWHRREVEAEETRQRLEERRQAVDSALAAASHAWPEPRWRRPEPEEEEDDGEDFGRRRRRIRNFYGRGR